MLPKDYLKHSPYRDLTHMHNAMADAGFTITYPMLRRNALGSNWPSQEAWEAWEDFTYSKVTRQDLVDQRFKFLAEKE